MKNILIIDDSQFMRSVLRDLLVDHNPLFNIDEANSKESALKKIKETRYDLMFLDIVMDESAIAGLELAKEIKNYIDVNNIVIISSMKQQAVIDEFAKLGIKYYLQKPYEGEDVIHFTKTILNIGNVLLND
jgi:two-component system chemotaxis response regulator CheY